MDADELRRRVDDLAQEPDRMRRRLVALGALTARLAGEGIEPILVGGCALEVYTDGGYATADVDLALPHSPVVDRAFADLGFEKNGRSQRWLKILLSEPPGRPPGRRPRDPEQEALLTELDRRRLERSELHQGARRLPVPPG